MKVTNAFLKKHKACVEGFKFTHCLGHNQLYMREGTK